MRAHKYNAHSTEFDGIKFDSKAEMYRYKQLKLLEMAGKISNLQVHPRYELLKSFVDFSGASRRGIVYEADFCYSEDGNPLPVVEDIKGVETEAFKLKKKLFLFHHPELELRIIKA